MVLYFPPHRAGCTKLPNLVSTKSAQHSTLQIFGSSRKVHDAGVNCAHHLTEFPSGNTRRMQSISYMCINIPLSLSCSHCLFFFFFSGSAWFAEMALEHQPAPTKPASAHEGGRRRGGQGVCMPFLRP